MIVALDNGWHGASICTRFNGTPEKWKREPSSNDTNLGFSLLYENDRRKTHCHCFLSQQSVGWRAIFRPSRNPQPEWMWPVTAVEQGALTQLHSDSALTDFSQLELLKSGAETHALRYTMSIARLPGAIWFPKARLFDCLLQRFWSRNFRNQ